MSLYWKSCPYCGRTVQNGAGNPRQYFGNPKRSCRYCGSTYIDSSVIDWPNASFVRKLSYCFANGRLALCVFPYLTSVATAVGLSNWPRPWISCLPVFFLSFALCVLYVRWQAKRYYGNELKHKSEERDIQRRTIAQDYEKYADGLYNSRPCVKKGAVEKALKKNTKKD